VLRESTAYDRAAIIDLFSSPEVGAHIGGAQPREELERAVPDVPGRRPGFFVVEREGHVIGMVTLDPPNLDLPEDVSFNPEDAELGYMFLPHAWGHGYATEACAAALEWFADTYPGASVVACPQTANKPSVRVLQKLGFTERQRFHAYGAELWLGLWHAPAE
jgi:RimJ/RimL family protein N-acetyltransferase